MPQVHGVPKQIYDYLGKINQTVDRDKFVPNAKNVALTTGMFNNPLLRLKEVDNP